MILIAERFIADCNERMGKDVKGLSPEAREAILAYRWPGNVRELQNAIEHAFVMEQGDLLTPESLPANVLGGRALDGVFRDYPRKLDEAREEFTRRFVRECLEFHRGDAEAASAELGIATDEIDEILPS